jgi:hypothetical protein
MPRKLANLATKVTFNEVPDYYDDGPDTDYDTVSDGENW